MMIVEPDEERRISLRGITDPLAAWKAVSTNARGVIRLLSAAAIEKLERRLEAITPSSEHSWTMQARVEANRRQRGTPSGRATATTTRDRLTGYPDDWYTSNEVAML